MDSMPPEKNVQKVLRLKEEINQGIQELEFLAKVFRKNLKTCHEQRRRISPFGRNDMGVAIFCRGIR